MKLTLATTISSSKKSHAKEQARVQIIILPLIYFALGVGATVLWFQFNSNRHMVTVGSPTSSAQMNNAAATEQPINPNRPSRPFAPSHPPVDATTIEQVKQAIPNYTSVSLTDGIQALREAALKQFKAATKETDVRVQEAQQRLIQAEKGQSATEQQAARKHLQETQAAAAEKLQQIAAELQAQIVALKQLKGKVQ